MARTLINGIEEILAASIPWSAMASGVTGTLSVSGALSAGSINSTGDIIAQSGHFVAGNGALCLDGGSSGIYLRIDTTNGVDTSYSTAMTISAAGAVSIPGALSAASINSSAHQISPNETPGGTPNGTLTTFTLAHAPVNGFLLLFQNGALLRPGGVDYTLSGTTITMATAPQAIDVLTAFYFY